MHIKNRIKKIPFVYKINALLKQKQQERLSSDELNYYRFESARKGISVQSGDALADLIRERLLERGISPVPKKKGDLHIFLAYPLKNWEYILPKVLTPFGKVTTFSWQSGGFFDRGEDWFKWRHNLTCEMLSVFMKAITQQSIDVMIGYLSDFNMKKETLEEIGKRGVVIFNMNWDDKLYFNGGCVKGQPRSLKNIVSAVDLNLTNAPDSCIKYMVEGGFAMFWPEAAHPDIHKPYDCPFEYEVSFVGTKNAPRERLMHLLKKEGITVMTFGRGWGNGFLSEENIVSIYSKSKINLGFAGAGYSRNLMCLKGRDFEIPMAGGLYLTQDNPELALVYEVGKEIVTYTDEKDCAKKIRWLLENPNEAEEIRKAGRNRALKEHTWEKRFSDIFKLVGFLN